MAGTPEPQRECPRPGWWQNLARWILIKQYTGKVILNCRDGRVLNIKHEVMRQPQDFGEGT